jgi:ribosome-binding factor A
MVKSTWMMPCSDQLGLLVMLLGYILGQTSDLKKTPKLNFSYEEKNNSRNVMI